MLKKITRKTLSLGLALLLLSNMGAAEDSPIVIKDTTYIKGINYVIDQGIFQGYPDGTFKETQTINRAELLKILILSSNSEDLADFDPEEKVETCFKDVEDTDWFAPYVCQAKDLEIVQGYSDETFRGEDEINLAEALKLLFLLNDLDYSEEQGEEWYTKSFDLAQEINILPNESIQVSDKLSRGESAELIARIQHYNNDTLEVYLSNDTEVKVQIPEAINIFDPLANILEDEDFEVQETVLLEVPFTSQAPTKKWILPYAEACEEAALIMVDHFGQETDLSVELADKLILDIVAWEESKDYIIDISAQEMQEISKEYLEKVSIVYEGDQVTTDNIKHLLNNGFPVIIPIAGREIGNPYYIGAGPPYHVVVIVGYDSENFIINDPGTQFGEHLSFSQEVILEGIHNWAGSKSNVLEGEKAMLVLSKA